MNISPVRRGEAAERTLEDTGIQPQVSASGPLLVSGHVWIMAAQATVVMYGSRTPVAAWCDSTKVIWREYQFSAGAQYVLSPVGRCYVASGNTLYRMVSNSGSSPTSGAYIGQNNIAGAIPFDPPWLNNAKINLMHTNANALIGGSNTMSTVPSVGVSYPTSWYDSRIPVSIGETPTYSVPTAEEYYYDAVNDYGYPGTSYGYQEGTPTLTNMTGRLAVQFTGTMIKSGNLRIATDFLCNNSTTGNSGAFLYSYIQVGLFIPVIAVTPGDAFYADPSPGPGPSLTPVRYLELGPIPFGSLAYTDQFDSILNVSIPGFTTDPAFLSGGTWFTVVFGNVAAGAATTGTSQNAIWAIADSSMLFTRNNQLLNGSAQRTT